MHTLGGIQSLTVISDADQKGVILSDTPGGTQAQTVISDPDQKGGHQMSTLGGTQIKRVRHGSGPLAARSVDPERTCTRLVSAKGRKIRNCIS